jgi:hypothetical protein
MVLECLFYEVYSSACKEETIFVMFSLIALGLFFVNLFLSFYSVHGKVV